MLNRNKHFTLVIAFVLISSALYKGQRGYKMEFGALTGISNYLGEIGGRSTKARPWLLDLKMAKTRWNEGLYMRYRFHRLMAVRLALNYLRIEGDDKLSIYAPRRYRNLSFRNDIFDFETTLHLMLYDSKKPIGFYSRTDIYFSSYVFVGAGVFRHNPKTKNQAGQWVALQPIETEGTAYSRIGFCVPVGIGFYVTLNKRRRSHRIGMEINWRYTTTDYLDDVSTTYKSPGELSSLAYDLSNRNDELTRQPANYEKNYGWHGYKADGVTPENQAPRGNPKNLDSYISLNITYGIAIKSRYARSKGRRIRTVSF